MSAVPQGCRTGIMSSVQLIDRVLGVLPGGSFIRMALHCAFMMERRFHILMIMWHY
jgi:hypothetical protein